MRIRQLILPLVLLFSQALAQSGYVDQKPLSEPEQARIYASLDDLARNYHYPGAVSSVYDSLILNTHDYEPHEKPLWTNSVIRSRLQDIPAVISMDFNSYVKRYIEVYARDKKTQTAQMLGLQKVYFPIFEQALDRRNMPIELKYLAVVESALNPHARSRVGATGLWQFMLATGREYGLSVNSYVDERKNPYKSTEAALSYLQRAYGEFGDWLLAIASYNCGPGNVRKAIRRSGGSHNFWTIRRYLPRETRGYVPAFIAATYVFNYASEHNIYPVEVPFNYYSDTVHIKQMDISLKDIAKMTDTDLEILRILNPELQLSKIPYSSRTYILRTPAKVSNYFASNTYTIRERFGKKNAGSAGSTYAGASAFQNQYPKSTKPKSTYTPPKPSGKLHIHIVKKGEVVGAIAEAYGVSSRNVSRWNRLYHYRIKLGQRLKIYSNARPKKVVIAKTSTAAEIKTKIESSSSNTYSKKPSGIAVYHTIRRGESIWTIAKRYPGVTQSSILRLNKGIDPTDLKVGQKIRVK